MTALDEQCDITMGYCSECHNKDMNSWEPIWKECDSDDEE